MSRLLAERNRLEANLRDELTGQGELLELLRRQEKAVVARTAVELLEVTGLIESELSAAAARRLRREPILRRVAELMQLAPSSLTLRSIVERLGDEGQRLRALREELREAASRVVRQNRRVAAVVGLHRRLNQEVLELVLAEEDSNPFERTGALVDAEV
jgi:hypothetical protein